MMVADLRFCNGRSCCDVRHHRCGSDRVARGCEDDATVAGPVAPVVDPLAGLNSNDVPMNAAGGRRFIARSTAAVDATPGEVIQIEMTDEAISFPASCNTATAAYVVLEDVLHLSTNQVTTLVACSPQQDAEASRISTMLNEQPSFDIDGDVLTIATATSTFQLIDATCWRTARSKLRASPVSTPKVRT